MSTLKVPKYLTYGPIPSPLQALLDAAEFASELQGGFDLLDVRNVEAFWEVIDAFSTAHGFVVALADRRRVYLQLIVDHSQDEPSEELQILPMGDERYPQLEGGGIEWCDDVQVLNQLLRS